LVNYIRDYIEISGNGKWCEDKAIICDECVGVLDGATPIDIEKCNNYLTQACWFVSAFENYFLKNIKVTKGVILPCCTLTTSEISRQYKKERDYNSPCCTAAFVNISSDRKKVLIYLIGDCHVYIETKKGETIHYYDDRVDVFSHKTLEISKNNKFDRDVLVRNQKILNRNFLNQPNGFYAIDLSDDYVKGFIKKEISCDLVNKILVCSDGFARVFLEYGILKISDFFKSNISLLETANLIRDFERDLTNVENKCVKKSDDISAVLLLF